RLHFTAHLHGKIIFVISDIAPAQTLPLADVTLEPHLMRQAERQQALGKRARGGNLFTPDAESTLAVEHLAPLERAFSRRGDVGAEARRRTGRLLAQRDAGNRHAELEPDHVNRPIERGVAPALVRQHRVFFETAPRIVALALEHDIGAEREMMRYVATVAVDRRGDFGDARFLQRAARRLRLTNVRELEARCRGKAQALALRYEPGGIAHRSHLDARLRAVDEAVEHFRIDRAAVRNREIFVENVPHGIGRGAMIVRLIARALAGGDHGESASPRPVDMVADKRRLIAPGEAVDHARSLRFAREQGAGERIGFDVDHDDVLAMGNCAERMMYAGARKGGRLADPL